MGVSTPRLESELFGLIYLVLESSLEIFTLKTKHRAVSGNFSLTDEDLHVGILVIVEKPVVVD